MEDLVKSFFILIAILGAIALVQCAVFFIIPCAFVVGVIFFFSKK